MRVCSDLMIKCHEINVRQIWMPESIFILKGVKTQVLNIQRHLLTDDILQNEISIVLKVIPCLMNFR